MPNRNAEVAASPLVTLYRYDDQALLNEITVDPRSARPGTVRYDRDWAGRIETVEASVDSSRTLVTTLSYDPPPVVYGAPPSRTLVPNSITHPDGSVTALTRTSDGAIWTITADSSGPNPISVSITYDAYGRVKERDRMGHLSAERFDRNPLGALKSEGSRGPSGEWRDTTYAYDAGGRKRSITRPLSTTTFDYSPLGQVRWIAQAGNDLPSRVTCMNHAADGLLLEAVLADGSMKSFQYGDGGQLLKIMSGSPTVVPDWVQGCFTSLAAAGLPAPPLKTDPAGLALVQSLNYDKGGAIIGALDGTAVGLRFVLDGLGRVVDAIDGADTHHRRGFDTRGRVTWEATYGTNPPPYAKPTVLSPGVPLQSMTEYEYDDLDRTVHVAQWLFEQDHWVDPANPKVITTIEFDDEHNTSRVRVGNASPVVIARDGVGRILAMETANGAKVSVQRQDLQPDGELARFTARGIDGITRSRWATYGSDGRLQQLQMDGAGAPGRTVLVNKHDADGRLILKRYAGGAAANYVYDAFDRIANITDANDASLRALSFGYDSLDRLASVGDASGFQARIGYDDLGRQKQVQYSNGDVARWAYDSVSSRVAGIVDAFGVSRSFAYDGAGRLASETVTGPADLDLASGVRRRFSYTPLGLLDTVTLDPLATNQTPSSIGFQYDSLGHVVLEDSSMSPVQLKHRWGPPGASLETRLVDRQGMKPDVVVQTILDDAGRAREVQLNGRRLARWYYEQQSGRVEYGSGAVIEQPSYDGEGRWAGVQVLVNGAVVADRRETAGQDSVVRKRRRVSHRVRAVWIFSCSISPGGSRARTSTQPLPRCQPAPADSSTPSSCLT
jgi:YD repeat-containing protein